jgi:acetyl esterase/lipase
MEVAENITPTLSEPLTWAGSTVPAREGDTWSMLKSLIFAVCVALVSCRSAQVAPPVSAGTKTIGATGADLGAVPATPTQLQIWPGTVPDAQQVAAGTVEATEEGGRVAGRPYLEVSNVSRPTVTVYPPKGKNTGAAVVVFPGGGYKILAIDLEGTEVCDWLTSKGITCVLLKYRVPYSGHHWNPQCKCYVNPKSPTALQDAQRALGLVRFHAAEWHIDPHKIGVLGFSAGGHLSAAISTHFERRLYPAVDAADEQSCRPDFSVVIYPGHLWISEDRFELNPDVPVTRQTPPTFLLQAQNDDVDDVNHSLVYYIALKKAEVPVEMHLYAEGGHAFGLRPTRFPITRWPRLVETWLTALGMIAE